LNAKRSSVPIKGDYVAAHTAITITCARNHAGSRNAAAPQALTLKKEPALMEHQDKTASEHDRQYETALEEIARETRATSVRTWAVTGVVAAVLLGAVGGGDGWVTGRG